MIFGWLRAFSKSDVIFADFFFKRFSWRPSWFYSFCAAKTNKNLFIILVDPQNWYVDIKNLGFWLVVMVNFWTFLEHFPKKGGLWRPSWIFSKSSIDSFRPTSDLKSAEKVTLESTKTCSTCTYKNCGVKSGFPN